MSKKSVALIALLIFSPVLIYLLWSTDQSRIKRLFREGVRAFEQKRLEGVMSRVSYTYQDDKGITYVILKNGLESLFRQINNITVEYDITGLSINDNTAIADLDLRIIATWGQETGYVLGDAARPAHVKFYIEKEGGRWLVSKTSGLPQPF